jgi:protein subunit release factor A
MASLLNQDIRVDTSWTSFQPIKMRITHIPTGIVVTGEGYSQVKLREELMVALEAKFVQP